MGQAQINVRTRACSRASIARTKQAALTHNVRGKELNINFINFYVGPYIMDYYFLTPVHKLGGTHHCLPRQKDALDWMSQYVKGLRAKLRINVQKKLAQKRVILSLTIILHR